MSQAGSKSLVRASNSGALSTAAVIYGLAAAAAYMSYSVQDPYLPTKWLCLIGLLPLSIAIVKWVQLKQRQREAGPERVAAARGLELAASHANQQQAVANQAAQVARQRQARQDASRAASAAAARRSQPPGAVGVRCPSCQGAEVRRVSGGERARSGIAGGLLFAKKARAQFACANCGYFW